MALCVLRFPLGVLGPVTVLSRAPPRPAGRVQGGFAEAHGPLRGEVLWVGVRPLRDHRTPGTPLSLCLCEPIHVRSMTTFWNLWSRCRRWRRCPLATRQRVSLWGEQSLEWQEVMYKVLPVSSAVATVSGLNACWCHTQPRAPWMCLLGTVLAVVSAVDR